MSRGLQGWMRVFPCSLPRGVPFSLPPTTLQVAGAAKQPKGASPSPRPAQEQGTANGNGPVQAPESQISS